MVSAAKFQLAERELKPARTYGEGAQGTPYMSLVLRPKKEPGTLTTIPSKLSIFGYIIVLNLLVLQSTLDEPSTKGLLTNYKKKGY